jgi:TP901-1 family phage major tail protein
MTAYAGKDFLLMVGDGAGPEVFTVMGGLRSSSITINGENIDVTDQNSGQWQTLLSGAGIVKVAISGSGIFNNSANELLAITRVMDKTLHNYEIVDGTGKAFKGAFKISKLERKGDYKGAQDYSLSLESSGPITYA